VQREVWNGTTRLRYLQRRLDLQARNKHPPALFQTSFSSINPPRTLLILCVASMVVALAAGTAAGRFHSAQTPPLNPSVPGALWQHKPPPPPVSAPVPDLLVSPFAFLVCSFECCLRLHPGLSSPFPLPDARSAPH
jgi:hypothetical protein